MIQEAIIKPSIFSFIIYDGKNSEEVCEFAKAFIKKTSDNKLLFCKGGMLKIELPVGQYIIRAEFNAFGRKEYTFNHLTEKEFYDNYSPVKKSLSTESKTFTTPSSNNDDIYDSEKSEIYIGTKIVKAIPMKYGNYLKSSKQLPVNIMNVSFPGEASREGYKVIYEDGYKSWSPKDVFERSYRILSANEIQMIR